MATLYHRIAGANLDRLSALSDGVFAVALTLLVLDIRVPVAEHLHSERALWHALLPLAPRVLAYFLSFLTLGIFWLAQQAQFNTFARSDRRLTWIHLVFLLGVTVLPFSTSLLAEFITFRTAVLVYWLNLLLLGAALLLSLRHARRAELLAAPEAFGAQQRRILAYQACYALAAALCVVSTYASIGIFVALQLTSAVAAGIRRRDRGGR